MAQKLPALPLALLDAWCCGKQRSFTKLGRRARWKDTNLPEMKTYICLCVYVTRGCGGMFTRRGLQ